MYWIVILALENHAMHDHASFQSASVIEVTLDLLWLCSTALLIPASAIGASELSAQGGGRRLRATLFVVGLWVGVVAEYWASAKADHRWPSPFVRNAWLHDGRSWDTLVCLVAIGVFAGAALLLKPLRGADNV